MYRTGPVIAPARWIFLALSAALHGMLLRAATRSFPAAAAPQMEVRRGVSAVELNLLAPAAVAAPEPESLAKPVQPEPPPIAPPSLPLPQPEPELQSVTEQVPDQPVAPPDQKPAETHPAVSATEHNADPNTQGVDVEAEPEIDCNPVYPRLAVARGYEGTVVIALTVRADGTIRDEQIRQSSGHPLLDKAALSAIRRSRFKPARRNGRPVESSIEQAFVFKLENSR